MSMRFETNCINADGDAITEMVDAAKEVTWRTFLKNVGADTINEEFGDCTPALKDDYTVSFWKSKYHALVA